MSSRINLVRIGTCPLCRNPSQKAMLKLLRTEVYHCVCGMEYIDPSLDAASMSEIYRSSEALKEINPALETYYEYELKPGCRTWRDYETALRRAQKYAPGRRLMEVGCGGGEFLKFARNLGWQVSGLDSAPENIEKVRRAGMGGICSSFLEYTGDEKFDVVVQWDLIEHPQDPAAFVRKSHDMLVPGGLLLFATPCYPNLLSEIAKLFYALTGGRLKTPAEKMYFLEHTTYFGPQTLKKLVVDNVFETAQVWKTETDLKRYKFNPLVRFVLNTAFICARFLRLQNRLILIARKV